MINKKISSTFGILVVLIVAGFFGYVFLMENEKDNKKITESNAVSNIKMGGIDYKIAGSNCKIGVNSVDGSTYNVDFFKVCLDGTQVKIDNTTCKFESCPKITEMNTDNWKTYVNKKYELEIKYPEKWYVQENEELDVVQFRNVLCKEESLAYCPGDYFGYTLSLTAKNSQESIANDSYNRNRIDFSSELENIKLRNGEIVKLYVLSEVNESNFTDLIDTFLPEAFGSVESGNSSIYFESWSNYYSGDGSLRKHYDAVNYLKAAIKTLDFY